MRHVFSVAAQVAPGSLRAAGVRTVFTRSDLAPTVRLGPSVEGRADYADSVEPIVREAAAWTWRLLVILAAVVALL